MNKRRDIITVNNFNTIPPSENDWMAYFDGEEERREYGWGKTKQEAISDLLENYEQ